MRMPVSKIRAITASLIGDWCFNIKYPLTHWLGRTLWRT